jgi:hypothetical protein
MKHLIWAGLAGLACLAATAAPALGLLIRIIPTPIPQRVALADIVVVGKVTGFGDKLVSAKPPGGGDAKVDYQIAIVQVGDSLLGAKDVKEIKVAFIPPPPPPAPGTGPVIRPIRGMPRFSLTLDQEGCLFLVKHPTEDFYIAQNTNDFISKKDNADFDKNMDEVKRSVQLLADPMAVLKGKNNDDRFLTAAMLIARYRTPRPGETKTEAIDAEESKQILQALADADWTVKPAPGIAGLQTMNPQNIFYRLNLTPQDGWTQPADALLIPDVAKQWLKDNAEKYRIQRFVADKKDDK